MKEQKGYAQLISSGHNNSNIIAPSYISDIAEPHDTYKEEVSNQETENVLQ